jgi:iron complex outermembrane receptor protein
MPFELGYKGSNSDGSISYSVAAFLYDYQNVQISFVDETSTVSTVNAAEAENYGLEFELDAQMTDALSMDFFRHLPQRRVQGVHQRRLCERLRTGGP